MLRSLLASSCSRYAANANYLLTKRHEVMSNTASSAHVPVLLQPVIEGLSATSHPDGLYVDGTVGAGGHASAVLEAASQSRLVGFDRDPRSLSIAHETLSPFGDPVALVHANYNTMGTAAPQHRFARVDDV